MWQQIFKWIKNIEQGMGYLGPWQGALVWDRTIRSIPQNPV